MAAEVEVAGTCVDRFEPVRAAFLDNLDTGQDIGAAVAVFVDGEPVVDLWGGHFDATYTRPFGPYTIVQCFSSTNTITALCALILADRGELDLDAAVAHSWPEIAAEGKGDTVVRQLLGHTSGMSAWSEPMMLCDVYDRERSTARLARQAPGRSRGGFLPVARRSPTNYALVVGLVVAPIIALVGLRDEPGGAPFVLTALGVALTVIGPLLTSRLLSEPTYDVILGWDPDALPADRPAVRRRYFALNWVRAVFTWVAFALFLAASHVHLR